MNGKGAVDRTQGWSEESTSSIVSTGAWGSTRRIEVPIFVVIIVFKEPGVLGGLAGRRRGESIPGRLGATGAPA